jgi:hypothetical protein
MSSAPAWIGLVGLLGLPGLAGLRWPVPLRTPGGLIRLGGLLGLVGLGGPWNPALGAFGAFGLLGLWHHPKPGLARLAPLGWFGVMGPITLALWP